MQRVIRVILTLALVYGDYTETGIFTALSLFLIFSALEVQVWLTKRSREFPLKSPTQYSGLCDATSVELEGSTLHPYKGEPR